MSDLFEPVIGLEVHCQLNTQSKLFCGCSSAFGSLPNHHTCPVCLGMPGALPVLNKQAVDHGIALALAVGAEIREKSVFARKQYFYADLPKGYQISQYDLPYCEGGGIKLSNEHFIELIRIHLEEDAGKNIHADDFSYVDLNRAGVPLLEIVTTPCVRSAEEASEYLKRLRSIVRYLGISDGNLEEGSFRCDVNLSIRPKGSQELGTRCEIKNLNSFRNIEKAIAYEFMRQVDLRDDGIELKQQTLLYDPASGKTAAMRSKEEAQDYRYFPEPDLTALTISKERIAQIKSNLPELPNDVAKRFREVYELNEFDAGFLSNDKDLADFYEQLINIVSNSVTPKIVANWTITEYMHAVGNKLIELNPDAKVIYISSERFMNEMIYCIRFNKMWEFRQKYRNCDAFLVDDIQFISHKKSTQEEFFHTFNSLYEAKKQIVITSDMFPQDIPDIEERLRNRFQWGLIADIQPPDMEHRMAILLNKADQLGIQLSVEVAEYIATNAKRNVRELEGALHRITAFAALQGRPIDISLATEIFQNVLSEPPRRLTIESIQKTVADFFKIKIVDLKSKKRQKALTLPRQVAMYLSRNLTQASFPEIGEKFGGKDHTTVMHAVKKVTKDISQDFELKSNIETLERQLEQLN